MKFYLGALAALCLCMQPAFAECVGQNLLTQLPPTERAALDARAALAPFYQGNLWRATKGDAAIIMVGTYHLDDPRHDYTLAAITPFVTAATTVMVEAGPEEEAAIKARITQDPSAIIITSGPSLMQQLPADDWQRLAAAMSLRQVPGFMAAKFQPWYITMLLSIPPCAMEGGELARGLDQSVIDLATAKDIPLQALEPYDTIFKIFKAMPGQEQIEMIRTSLAMEEGAADMSVTLADAYFAQDSRVVWELLQDQALLLPGYSPERVKAEFAMMEESLMSMRNRAWIPVLENASAKGPVFAAFGALHLSGNDGVLALLERQGWQVERLPL
jgi:uncharacterized protein